MKKRVQWIDMAKGIGLILVMYGHIQFRPYPFYVWLCSFHMPLFFFLAGITFQVRQEEKFFSFFKKKVKALLIPYMIFASVTWFYRLGVEIWDYFRKGTAIDWGWLMHKALGILLQVRGSEFGIGVWFLPCIFVAFIILFAIIKISGGRKEVSVLLGSICLIIGFLYSTRIGKELPWSLDAALVAVFFMAIGNVFSEKLMDLERNHCVRFNMKNVLTALIAIVGSLLFSWCNYGILDRAVGMWSNNYGDFWYFILGVVGGIAITVIFCNACHISFLKQIGKNSIFYYGIHGLFVERFSRIFRQFPGADGNGGLAFLYATVMVAVILLILGALLPAYQTCYQRTTDAVAIRWRMFRQRSVIYRTGRWQWMVKVRKYSR